MRISNPKTIVRFIGAQKADRSGYLWKRKSETKGSFKRRYFVVYGNILAYFERQTDKEPLGILFLESHVVEMVDDLTMVVRFLTVKDLSKGYYLRGESTEDIEQWMRVLSRSGTDFFILTLEDLEDQLRAVAAVSRASSVAVNFKNRDASPSSSSCRFDPPPRRQNPFNSTAILGSVGTRNIPSTRSFIQSDQSTRMQSVSSANLSPNRFGKQEMIRGPGSSSVVSPGLRHLEWLFTQNWEQLHARIRTQLSETLASIPPSVASIQCE